MIELLPALLTQTREEFETRVRAVENLAPMAQIDILDDTWLPGKTWADPGDISATVSPLLFELHLMVAHPVEHLEAWSELPSLKRVVFHLETALQPKQVVEAIRFYGWDVVVAINPETPAADVLEILPYVDEVMCLTVKPGASGRPFEHGVLKKIAELAANNHHAIIGVDGAITAETLPLCIAAGATRIRVNSALFGGEKSVAEAWAELEKIAQESESR